MLRLLALARRRRNLPPQVLETVDDRYFHRYVLDRVRLLTELVTVRSLIWLSMLGRDSELLPETHDGLALIYLRLEDVESRAQRVRPRVRYHDRAAAHSDDLAELYFELEAEARAMRRPIAAERFRRRGEVHLTPGPRHAAAMAMPVPVPYQRVDARGKLHVHS